MDALRRAIEAYIYGKDGNRPHLLEDAFSRNAELSIKVNSTNISFPEEVTGSEEISKILVTEFSQRFENVYTWCIGHPPKDAGTKFECKWLVCMTEKHSGALRMGFGTYRWQLCASAGKVEKLAITIEQMHVLERKFSSSILSWAQRVPYPWCSVDLVISTIPEVPARVNICQGLA